MATPAPARFSKSISGQDISKFTAHNNYQVEQFKKSIKRDISYFTVLKDKKQFKSWHQNLLETAAAQDVEEILDSTYKPFNEEETN